MKKATLSLLLLISLLCFAATLTAQDATRCYERVTPFGTELVVVKGSSPPPAEPLVSPMTTPPGLVWDYPDGGLYWIPRNVSIGDRGTQVCAVCELNNERVELLSVFDGNPPTPIWTDTSVFGTDAGFACSSSSRGDLHVVCYQVNSPDIMNRIPVVNCYLSGSTTPDWTWNYGTTINYGTKVAIDRDAKRVAIAQYNNNTGIIDFYFLNAQTGAVEKTYNQAAGGLRGFDLSADGSRLYFHDSGASTCYILDIDALPSPTAIVTSAPTGGGFDGHCISGDGTKFANGRFGQLWIWEDDGSGNWGSYTLSTGSGNYVDEMDFSDDGTKLGFTVTKYSGGYDKTEAYIMEVATKTITASVINSSTGSTVQDVNAAAAISHDGRYFAVGRWGDDSVDNPEVTILEDGVGLVGTINTAGSVFGLDISRDGQVTAAGAKSIHANISGKGGNVYCYDLGGEDMDVIGPPRIGQNCQIDVYTNPDWFYKLWLCTGDDPDGFKTFLSKGTLYLDLDPPNKFFPSLLPVLQADSFGKGSLPAPIPNNPIFVGATVHLQALFSDGGPSFQFSKDYVTLTFLP